MIQVSTDIRPLRFSEMRPLHKEAPSLWCGAVDLHPGRAKCFQIMDKSWIRNLPIELFAQVIHLCQRLHHLSLLFQLQVLPVKPEGGDSVLCGVVGHPLDPSVQEVPGQELQRHPPMMRQMEKVDSVNGLLHGDNQVDHAEVVLEPVANEDAA